MSLALALPCKPGRELGPLPHRHPSFPNAMIGNNEELGNFGTSTTVNRTSWAVQRFSSSQVSSEPL